MQAMVPRTDAVQTSPMAACYAFRRKVEEPAQGSGRQAARGADPELDAADLRLVQRLRTRDRAVRSHEAAHRSALGPYAAGGASFTYQTGPDGRQYAIGGEVPIEASAEDDPAATLRKMQTLQRAALAPGDPSAVDRQVAGQAAALANQAQMELTRQQMRERQGRQAYGRAPTSQARDAAGAGPAA